MILHDEDTEDDEEDSEEDSEDDDDDSEDDDEDYEDDDEDSEDDDEDLHSLAKKNDRSRRLFFSSALTGPFRP